MFLFGHIGITTGVVQSYNTSNSAGRKVDLRAAAFMGLLPDLVDKPAGIIYRNILGNHTRLWGHSLIFSLVVFAILRLTRRWRRDAVILWLCCVGHLVLDRIWIADLPVLLWPFAGPPETVESPLLEKWVIALQQPWAIFGELLGLGILCHLVVRYRLYEKGRFARFLRTGRLELAIPRARP